MLRARVCDPLGPWWMRALAPTLGLALVVVGLLLPGAETLRAAIALLGVALLFASPLLRVRWGTREAELRLYDGWVDVRAGKLSQRVRARDLAGASTARTARGVALALARRGTSPARPMLLELASDDDLDRVRRVLGLGQLGFGEIAWPRRRNGRQVARLVVHGVIACGWATMAALAALGLGEASLGVVALLFPAMLAGMPFSLTTPAPGPRLLLTAGGFVVFDPAPSMTRYADVREASAAGDDVVIGVEGAPAPLVVPLPHLLPEEREHIAAQLRSAADRAHGLGPLAEHVPAALSVLAPRDEESRAWLERLDATAASMTAAGAADAPADAAAGYRGASLRVDDLWTALESPDTATPVRAAAARVLARVATDAGRHRIARLLDAERDDTVRSLLRVAAEDDAEEAAEKLERLL